MDDQESHRAQAIFGPAEIGALAHLYRGEKLIPLRPGLANAVTSAAAADKNEERTWQLPRLHRARLPDFARRLSATLPG